MINIYIPLDKGGDEEDVPGAGVEGGGAGHQGRGDGILQLWIHHRNNVKQISALKYLFIDWLYSFVRKIN